MINGSFKIREGIFDGWVRDIKLAASNVTTQTQLQTVTGLGIGYCTDDIFAQAVPPNQYPTLAQTLQIEKLVADRTHILSFQDFPRH